MAPPLFFSFIFKRIRPFPSASVPGIPFGFLKEVQAVPEYPHRFRQEFLLRIEVPHVLSLFFRLPDIPWNVLRFPPGESGPDTAARNIIHYISKVCRARFFSWSGKLRSFKFLSIFMIRLFNVMHGILAWNG